MTAALVAIGNAALGALCVLGLALWLVAVIREALGRAGLFAGRHSN